MTATAGTEGLQSRLLERDAPVCRSRARGATPALGPREAGPPRRALRLADAFAAFIASQQDMLAFLRESADLDLARVRFPNPFVRGVRFSLATGFHVTVAHERRHLWQAWRVRRAAEPAR